MNIELLQQLCEASAVSGDEQEVRDILINTLEPCVNEITFDGLGSFCNFAFFSGLIGAQFWAERAQPKSPELDAKLLVSC